ncbi:phosphatase PAP2 family protein [Solwaraspora sp. WMMB335]|uniref:phosphatase PAP2 family protein n=1 Tax=Solwaraspora sp. WMMB335 TaxID=3404118 RepID=UPI003B95322F
MPEPVSPQPTGAPVDPAGTGQVSTPRSGWWLDGLLLVGLAGLTGALATGVFLDTDLAIRDWVDANRPLAAYWIARVLNFAGQGGWVLIPLSSLLALWLAVRVRSVRPLLPVAAVLVLTLVTIGPMKVLLPRGYPHDLDDPRPERLFTDATPAMAYPSGHVVNTIVWYAVIALLITGLLRSYGKPVPPGRPFPGYLTLRVLPTVIVFCTTVYLGYHWLTDSVAGLLLGLLLLRLLQRVPWDGIPVPALPNGLHRRAGLS